MNSDKLNKSVAYLKGIGPLKADLLQKEFSIFTAYDLLFHFPFRYVDKSVITHIKDLGTSDAVQVKGRIISKKIVKGQRKARLTATLKDGSGFIELVWFKGVNYIEKYLDLNAEYLAYGKVSNFKGKITMAHPELEKITSGKVIKTSFEPVYHNTEKLNRLGFDNKARCKILRLLIKTLNEEDLPETLPEYILNQLKLIPKLEAIKNIHFPNSFDLLEKAKNRIKFEEIFFFQLRMIFNKHKRRLKFNGHEFAQVGKYFNRFYKEKLPFELTGAQKRVIKEIRADLGSKTQMNRLLQGDVGSGKTMVGLLSMLIALDNGFQSVLMAPTEILAQQHFQSIVESVKGLGIRVAFLSGSVKGKTRKELLHHLELGNIHILIGTHAVLEDPVKFHNLGLSIIDEQHRFGVMQRSKLWLKAKDNKPPHILVMTATPIPRTLAMTVYGDLDVSVIDELPPGRKEIKTIHKTERNRPQVIAFFHDEIKKGRQIYIVYPLIDESEKLDLANLQEGYERLLNYFPPPEFKISVVHGRMKPQDKEMEMQRFVKGITQIMVATTVIEVGVNVPNASVMAIENTERFGLSQLHQLRGRVGRGAEQSYCILMSGYKLSREAKTRINTMVSTNDGFKIAEADLKLRGPGDIEGTRQSGVKEFNLFNVVLDQTLLQTGRHIVENILDNDPLLEHEKNKILKGRLSILNSGKRDWGRIS
ncbi:MAG: ATP-dependent DNA helicase RecG [Saprospiraceae bacterium]|nr:ATP-dependent DNA helicase RecG [Bacteroidia bacterium]NNE16314.1 ATP-dependent DNA helicase RecG [Saprospiraceae bacterium]NNL91374.1 ATP-dependent DNA helicase RecG [Saprospiraceae bacterium]